MSILPLVLVLVLVLPPFFEFPWILISLGYQALLGLDGHEGRKWGIGYIGCGGENTRWFPMFGSHIHCTVRYLLGDVSISLLFIPYFTGSYSS